jgi:hypothetical protein
MMALVVFGQPPIFTRGMAWRPCSGDRTNHQPDQDAEVPATGPWILYGRVR